MDKRTGINGRPRIDTMDCPCCDGKGHRRDAKSGLLRNCVACHGSGKVKNYKKYEGDY